MSKNNLITYQGENSYQFYLHSGNADIFINGSKKSNIVFFFSNALNVNKNDVQKRVSVVNAQFPYSWYLINSTNNSITINGTTYIFPEGNYTVNTFISTWTTVVGTGWTITYNNINKKLTFAFTSDFTFSDNKLYKIIGFLSSSYSSTNKILTAPFCVNFSGINKINIKTSTFALNNVDSYNKGKTRTLCSVPVNANQNNIIFYNNYTQYNSVFKNQFIDDINIEIQDEFKNYIDFNNCDFSITLQIDILSEHVSNIDDMHDLYESFNNN